MNSTSLRRFSKITLHLFLLLASFYIVLDILIGLGRLRSGSTTKAFDELGLDCIDNISLIWILILIISLYLLLSDTIQAVFKTLSEHRAFIGIILATLYVLSAILWLGIFTTIFDYFIFLSIAGVLVGDSTDPTALVLTITALTGLISAVSGVIAQLALRKKTLADIEIEKQKLKLEREKLNLEKMKALPGRKEGRAKKTPSA